MKRIERVSIYSELYAADTHLDVKPSCDLVGLVLVEVESIGDVSDGDLHVTFVIYELLHGLLGGGNGESTPGKHAVNIKADAEAGLQQCETRENI